MLLFRFISNKYLVKRQSRDYDVEWGYAFDVHLNAFYPLLVILHFIQLFFINRKYAHYSAAHRVVTVHWTHCLHVSGRCHPDRHVYWLFGWKHLLVDCSGLLHLCDLPGIQR